MDGTTWTAPVRAFPLVIEPSVVAEFARSVGLVDERSVPPTFAVVADRVDPAFPRRPAPGGGWPDGPPETLLHVEQWFELHHPLSAGETVEVRRGPGRRWERAGRSGRLEFLEERTELLGSNGLVRVATGWVDVRTETTHRELTVAQRDVDDARPVVGARDGEAIVARDLSITHFVRYVGASGDFHPLHHDPVMARSLGYRDVFAPGMLTMAMTLRTLDDAVGIPGRSRISSRFRAQVWPGDSLFLSFTSDGGALTVRTRNQHDDTVLETTVEPL